MKRIKINKLTIKNFKGISDFVFEPDGKDCSIYAANAIGKTTIANAWIWLLCGKNYEGKSDQTIKPITEKDNPDIETIVEADINNGLENILLKKTYTEKWTKKKRGHKKEFVGYTTSHYINNMPQKKKQYENFINNICDINKIKIMTILFEFSTLPWQEKRKILLDLFGTFEYDNKTKELEDNVSSILDGIDENIFIEMLKTEKKRKNKELESIPSRIAENKEIIKSMTLEKLESNIEDIENKLIAKEEQLRIESSNEVLSIKKIELNNIESIIITHKNDFNKEHDLKISNLRKDYMEKLEAHNKLKSHLSNCKMHFASTQEKINLVTNRTAQLRSEWNEEYEKEFDGNNICPTCNNPLREDQIEELSNLFNLNKSKHLIKITNDGKKFSNDLDALNKKLSKLSDKIEELKINIITSKDILNKLKKSLEDEELIIYSPDLTTPPYSIRDEIIKDIELIKSGNKPKLEEIINSIDSIKDQIARHTDIEHKKNQIIMCEKRIECILDQESYLCKELEKLDNQLDIIEDFVMARCNLIEKNTNRYFYLVSFRLFNIQINGNINQCCDIVIDNIDFAKDLNTGNQINASIDIINSLGREWGISLPIFIDSCESVNKLIKTDNQMIKLYVSNDQKLTIKGE